jgi:DNA-binding MarR family transcriptional regulator
LLHAGKDSGASLTGMDGKAPSVAVTEATRGDSIAEIQSALHSLARSLKRGTLHEFLLAQAHVDADQAGLAVLHVLHLAGRGLRLTDLAEQLSIDAPAVTRKVQQLERSGLVSRMADQIDARATRVQLTAAGRRTINKFMAARRAWLEALIADWPALDKADFARLLGRFSGAIHEQLEELDD